ncbi:MAG: multidrug efflux SMR transporter [Nevskia sp.]|nr:multidrug efflux SMR transporter [Nevskia sp.]
MATLINTPTGFPARPVAMLAIAIVSEVVATMLLKACDGWTHWKLGLASLSCYAFAGLLLSFVLQRMSVGIAYGVWAGAGIALICLASAWWWGQSLDWPAMLGLGLIVCGVALITLKSSVVLP